MTKEQLIDIFARFILENSAGDKYFYPKDRIKFKGHNVFSIHYTKLYDDYEIHTIVEPNYETGEIKKDYYYYFRDQSFQDLAKLYVNCIGYK